MAEEVHNPGGYRPDDPRYGLYGESLKAFYNSRPAQWFIRCMYKPDSLDIREQALPAHTTYLRAHADDIWFAGPLLADDGQTPIGTIVVIEAPDKAAAETFIAEEGYNKAGLFDSIEIHRFSGSKRLRQGDRAPDPDMQMFVAECYDGPDAAERRKGAAAAHHKYQGSIIDRYVAHGPFRSDDGEDTVGSLFIIEVKDRAAAEDLVANEPMTAAGTFDPVRITRWRYGKSLSS